MRRARGGTHASALRHGSVTPVAAGHGGRHAYGRTMKLTCTYRPRDAWGEEVERHVEGPAPRSTADFLALLDAEAPDGHELVSVRIVQR